jgi:peptide-methionine (R)-S-oxide reductase
VKLDVKFDRRALFFGAAAIAGAASFSARATDMKPDPAKIPDYDKWQLSDREWKERLKDKGEAYDVLRREATERPWSSALNEEKRDGVFSCAGCGYDLFSTATKFDSGTGWPSFFDYLPDALGTKTDYKLILPRTEYHCARCGGHQGHLFDDGPSPTGLRYCNNGVALTFRAA